jgi:hypothetical protein
MDEPSLYLILVSRVADRIREKRGLSAEEAVAWVEERADERAVRAMIRTALATYQTFGDGEDREGDVDRLVELLADQVEGELEQGWRER